MQRPRGQPRPVKAIQGQGPCPDLDNPIVRMRPSLSCLPSHGKPTKIPAGKAQLHRKRPRPDRLTSTLRRATSRWSGGPASSRGPAPSAGPADGRLKSAAKLPSRVTRYALSPTDDRPGNETHLSRLGSFASAGSALAPRAVRPMLPRKEVIQPQLPLRLPCYDFVPITSPTFDACALAFTRFAQRLQVLPAFMT